MRPRIPAFLSVLALLLIALMAAPAQAAPSKPSSVKVAAQYNTGIRVQWAWKSGISSYQVQAATDPSFTTIARLQTVKGKSKRPSGAKMAVTVQPLKNATKYSFRVRARSGKTWSSWSSTVNGATKVGWPAKFTSVKGKAGPGAGQVTVSWAASGGTTTGFQLETAITRFSKTASSGLPKVGKNQRLFNIAPTQRSITLSAAQVVDAGAAGGSGIHLMFRLYAINKGTAGQQIRRYAYLQAVLPAARSSVIGGDSARMLGTVRAGTFNVRSAKMTTDKRNWLQRRADVAQQIVDERPDVLALQELGPGRADGKDGGLDGTMRQTTSLLDSLKKIGATRYKMVRTTPYDRQGPTRVARRPTAVQLRQGGLAQRLPRDHGRGELFHLLRHRAAHAEWRPRGTTALGHVRPVPDQGQRNPVLHGVGPPRRAAIARRPARRPHTARFGPARLRPS